MADIKHCPFCGGEAFCRWTDEGMEKVTYLYYVECDNCYIATPLFYDEEKAIERWNRRVEDGK